ncbi:MAG: hypothetical protein AT716_02975 [Vulcanisaeta sp. MG_3]|nr:MAG: hypothetical protein AT716_02975 [Vulcanisaeta sp. MG_3]
MTTDILIIESVILYMRASFGTTTSIVSFVMMFTPTKPSIVNTLGMYVIVTFAVPSTGIVIQESFSI